MNFIRRKYTKKIYIKQKNSSITINFLKVVVIENKTPLNFHKKFFFFRKPVLVTNLTLLVDYPNYE